MGNFKGVCYAPTSPTQLEGSMTLCPSMLLLIAAMDNYITGILTSICVNMHNLYIEYNYTHGYCGI